MTQQTEVSFRDQALAFSPQMTESMVKKIQASIDRRHSFETGDGSHAAGGSVGKSKAALEKNEIAVARFFLALGVDPKNVFERSVVEGKMLNAKSIKKIVELAQFSVGTGVRMEAVIRCFVACALIATDKLGDGVVFSNDVNARFLNSGDLSAFIADTELLEDMKERRHASMSTGAATQSSQMRNVLDVLGLGEIRKVNRERDAITLNAVHPFYADFRATYMAA